MRPKPKPRTEFAAALAAAAALLTLPACNSDKVHWSFVSDTGASGGQGGTGGGGILVIRGSGSFAQVGGDPGRLLTFTGTDDRGPVTVRMVTGGETVVLERPDRIAVRSAALAGEVDLGLASVSTRSDAACLQLDGVPAAALEPGATGRGRLLVASTGTLLALEHPGGVVARAGEAAVRRYGPGWTVAVDATTLRAIAPDGARFELLVPTPPPPPTARLRDDGERIELFGPSGRVVARIPRSAVTLHGGVDGRFLTARFPDGLAGVRSGPFALTVPTDSRYVLRIDF